MRWFDDAFLYRFPVVLDGSATAAGSVDATISLTALAAEFWATIQVDADDVRVSRADGLAGISYDLESLHYAGKTVTVELDGLTHHVTNTMTVVWLYFGDSDATNFEDGITASSPLIGYTLFTGPGEEPVYSLGSPAGATTPVNRRQKRADEAIFVWFAVGPFGDLAYPFKGRALPPEGPQSLTISVVTPGTFTANISALRLYQAQNGDVFCRATVFGGTDGVTSNIVLSVTTTEGRTLQGTVFMTCEDL